MQAIQSLKNHLEPYRARYPQRIGEDNLEYTLRLSEIEKCEGANQLEFIEKLPEMTQTYGTCFGVTAAQMGDYLRLETGQSIYMPTMNDVGAVMVDRLNRVQPPDTSHFPSSFFVSALDYYVSASRGDDLSILNNGGYFDETLEKMARSGGCSLSMYELMPSKDRRIFIEELGKHFKNLDMISNLPPQQAWYAFEEHFGAYLSLTSVSREDFQKGFDMNKWPKFESAIAKIRMSFEQMACPARDIHYPEFIINNRSYSSPLTLVDKYKGVQAYREILKTLKANKRPVPIYFCSGVIQNPFFKGLDVGISRLNSNECKPHAVLVVGAEYIESAKKCKLKVRNWWGSDYKYLDQFNPDEKGNFFLTEEQTNSNVYKTFSVELK